MTLEGDPAIVGNATSNEELATVARHFRDADPH